MENDGGGAIPSLRFGSASLGCISELAVPALPKLCLELRQCSPQQYATKLVCGHDELWQAGAPIPGAVGAPIRTRVARNERVTSETGEEEGGGRIRKPKYLLELEFDGEEGGRAHQIAQQFDAGDSCCVLFENAADEVDFLLDRFCYSANTFFELIWEGGTPPAALAHLPSASTARRIFTQFCDIRRAPSRSLIRALAEFAAAPADRRRLLELASSQGAAEFTKFVRQANISLAQLATTFHSLKPPLGLLIELLPRLLPRHYTLANFLLPTNDGPSTNNGNLLVFHFAYSLLPLGPHPRYGLCSQWLLGRNLGDIVWLLQKEPSKFRLPPPSFVCADGPLPHLRRLLATPLLMIGPGTGVAPFVAFLQKIRHFQRNFGPDDNFPAAKRTLIYASSSLEDEFLFRKELHELEADGIVGRLILCESRPPREMGRPKRVYEALRQMGEEVAALLMDDHGGEEGTTGGLVYACGDVKNMSRELWACLSEILQKHRGLSPVEAIERLKKLRQEERLIEDVWS